MTSIVVAVALVAAAGPEPDANVVPAGFFPGGGGAWSGTTTYYGSGREAPYGFGIGPEVTNSRLGVFGYDGRRYGAPVSPSPYDRAPAPRYGTSRVWVGGSITTTPGTGGGLFPAALTGGPTMTHDKDRAGKWLITRHGDSLLRLAGITGFTSWRAVTTETVAPRRLPDGLLEFRLPGDPNPRLLLVEIESYPDADVDRQVLDDLMLIAVERRAVPDVLCLVLSPKGNLTVGGTSERVSVGGGTRVGGAWPVVRAWELDSDALLAANDTGLIPLVPLARTADPPEAVMTRVAERVNAVADPTEHAGLVGAVDIMSLFAYPGLDFKHLYGGRPVLDKVLAEAIRINPVAQRRAAEAYRLIVEDETRIAILRETITGVLEDRFGPVPPEMAAAVGAVATEGRLKDLRRAAATSPDLAAFADVLAGWNLATDIRTPPAPG